MDFNDKFAKRLFDSISASRKAQRPFLDFRVESLRKTVGKHYGDRGTNMRRPANSLASGMDIYTRLLANRSPAVSVTTDIPEYRSTALYFSAHLTKMMRELYYFRTLQTVISDAMLLYGVTKRGMSIDKDHKWEYSVDTTELDLTKPFIKRVSPDDFIIDMVAREWGERQYAGDVIDVDKSFVLESGLYENVDQIVSTADESANLESQAKGLSRTKLLTGNMLFPTVRLMEIHIPRENVILTMPYDGGKIMRVQEWYGDEEGPYNFLSFGDIPDNVMPMSPAMTWIDLDEAINRLMRKFVNQADRSKTIPIGKRASKKDALSVRNANDGEIVLLDMPESIKEARFGGVDQNNWAFALWMIKHLNIVQGNPEALAGLGTVSDTARQEEQVLQRAGLKIDDMRLLVEKFVTSDARALAWYEWTEPLKENPITVEVKGVGKIRTVFSPWTREGEWLDYSFNVVPYSMSNDKPAEQATKLKDIVANIIVPLQPNLQAAGKMFNIEKFLELIAEKERIPEMDELITEAPQGPGQPQSERPTQAPVTRREYVRKNISGMSNAGFDQNMMQALMYGGAKNDAANS